ncbi:Hemolysin C [Thalassovita mediterranea]|uniref:Hemolysin C n=1 Tax=Thalassovita mediterranea TaxID=340021 RepID=A0A0P1H1W9_9RHOB|nr:hemolysin family protein [Thalassovita mediterranea]CUH84252.1 Hemolysin C [Thalassovita mediterranea]
MGDGPDGSSTAAHSAPLTLEHPKPGIFKRLFGAKGTAQTAEDQTAPLTQANTQRQHQTLMNALARVRVRDVAIPKADIIAVAETTSREELVQVLRETGFTRLPVYSGTLDTPLGMVHLKDFALRFGFNGGEGEEFSLKAMLRPLLYVPPSMSLGVLLQKMQTERRHMALVIDEFGGVDGLLTIEDLIEQVVGEIEDEHDAEDDKFWIAEKPGEYLALSKTPLDEFEEEIGLSLTDSAEIDEEEIDTLGGLVFLLCGRVPVRGEVVQHPAGHEIMVVDADPRRIKRLRVRLKTG